MSDNEIWLIFALIAFGAGAVVAFTEKAKGVALVAVGAFLFVIYTLFQVTGA